MMAKLTMKNFLQLLIERNDVDMNTEISFDPDTIYFIVHIIDKNICISNVKLQLYRGVPHVVPSSILEYLTTKI